MRILEKRQKQLRINTLCKQVFGTPEGKEVLAFICEQAYIGKPLIQTSDSHLTAHREGMRHLALSILTQIYKDPKALVEEINNIIKKEQYDNDSSRNNSEWDS